jgi:hypothetical protein
MHWCKALTIFCFLLKGISSVADSRLFFPPSIAPVKTVLLSYIHINDGRPNPRLQLIREIRETFPEIDIRITSDLPVEEMYAYHPELKKIVNAVVRIPMASIQDPLEFAWDREGELHALSFNRSDSTTIFKLFPEASLISVPNLEKGNIAEMKWITKTRWAGGNVEVLPDGTPIMGLSAPSDAVDFYSQLSGKSVLQVDTGWNSSGDMDEVFLWTNDPKKPGSCILFSLDVVAGSQLLTDKNIADYKLTEIEEIKKLFKILFEGKKFEENKLEAFHKDRIDKEILNLKRSLSEVPELQQLIEQESRKIMAHPSMKNCRNVRLPVIYAARDEETNSLLGGKFSMIFNNQINSLVIQNHAFMLKSNFPAQQKSIEKVFAENGFIVHPISAKGFNGGGGNMHCSTNTVREAIAVK